MGGTPLRCQHLVGWCQRSSWPRLELAIVNVPVGQCQCPIWLELANVNVQVGLSWALSMFELARVGQHQCSCDWSWPMSSFNLGQVGQWQQLSWLKLVSVWFGLCWSMSKVVNIELANVNVPVGLTWPMSAFSWLKLANVNVLLGLSWPKSMFRLV